ncbi:choline/carnitine O-acyltransferase [Bacillus sp. N9]
MTIIADPSLESTKLKLLEWIEPLVSAEQFQQTTNAIDRFLKKMERLKNFRKN